MIYKVKKTVIWISVICLMLPLIVPILTFADSEVWTMEYGDIDISLNIEPYENDLGLMVNAEDAAKIFSLNYEIDKKNKTFTVTGENIEKIVLMHNATQFCDGNETYNCPTCFYMENTIPMVELGFFSRLFNAAYEVNNNKITIYKNEQSGDDSQDDGISLLSNSDETGKSVQSALYGVVTAGNGAPYGGLDIELVLQQNSMRQEVYQTYYDAGESYAIGTVHLDEGETTKAYDFDVSQYYSDKYQYYSLFYREANRRLYGYYDKKGETFPFVKEPDFGDIDYNMCKFGYQKDNEANINLESTFNTHKVSGIISLEGNISAPGSGIDVELILQTRSKRYYSVYSPPYDIGTTHSLGKIHIPKGKKNVSYSYDVSEYYTDNKYPYYTLFYKSDDTTCVLPCGYVDSWEELSSIENFDSSSSYPYTYEFALFKNYDMNMTIPIQQSYLDKMVVKSPKSNYPSGKITEGSSIKLSCATDGAEIYYTTDGSTPTVKSTKYTEPIIINESKTIKAIATKKGMEDSRISQFNYIVSQKSNILYGDINSDGEVNRLDLLRLSKHFAGWDVEIDEKASDVNDDGEVNRIDLLRLSKYFAGWDVTLGPASDN